MALLFTSLIFVGASDDVKKGMRGNDSPTLKLHKDHYLMLDEDHAIALNPTYSVPLVNKLEADRNMKVEAMLQSMPIGNKISTQVKRRKAALASARVAAVVYKDPQAADILARYHNDKADAYFERMHGDLDMEAYRKHDARSQSWKKVREDNLAYHKATSNHLHKRAPMYNGEESSNNYLSEPLLGEKNKQGKAPSILTKPIRALLSKYQVHLASKKAAADVENHKYKNPSVKVLDQQFKEKDSESKDVAAKDAIQSKVDQRKEQEYEKAMANMEKMLNQRKERQQILRPAQRKPDITRESKGGQTSVWQPL